MVLLEPHAELVLYKEVSFTYLEHPFRNIKSITYVKYLIETLNSHIKVTVNNFAQAS